MEQTSRLSIVVDTTKAKTQIIDFNKRLEQMRLEGDKSSKAIGEIGSKANFSGLNQGLKAAQSNMAALSSTAKVSSNSLRAFSSVADNAAVATRKLSATVRELKNSSAGINANFNALAAVAASATKLSTAMRQASTSANSLKQFSQSANTSIVALNATLNLGASSLNKFSQAAVTAGQRLNTFGRAVTQTQTRLNGLNTNLASVRASMASLATASNSINAIFGNMNNTIGRLAAATDRLNNATTRANTAINQLGGNLGGANNQARGLLGTLNSLHGLLSSGFLAISGIGILKTADAMQSLNSQIKLVTNSEEEYLGIKQLLSDVADRNYSDIQATTDLYQKSARALANLGKSQADTIKFTEGVSLAMRTGGRSALEQSSAIYQLSQSMGAGVVNGDEFRTITETAPLLLQLVAKELGVTTGALKKLSSEGKIPAEVMFNAVTNNIQLLEEMAKQMPITMGQGFTLVKSRYKKFVDDMMNETGGFSSKIAGALAKISTKFDVMAKGAIAVGVLAFIQFAGSVNIAAKAMVLFNLAMKANPIVLVATAVLGVASAFYGLEDVLDTTGLILGDLIGAMGAGFRGLGNLVSTISEGISKAFGESNENVSKSYDGFFDNTAKGFSGFLQGVGRVAAAATATFNGFFSWMGNGFWQALRVAGNAFIWLGNTAKSIITEAGRTITDLINGAIGGINWLSESANDILSKTPITWRFKAIGEVEWRNPNYTQTPYFTITGDTLSENISKKYDFLKKGVDDYFAGPNGLAARSEAKRKEQSPYSPSTAEMDPKLAAMYRAQLAQDKLDAAKKAEKKAKKGGKTDSNQMMVYKAWRNAGLSDNQARIITAEVGREGDYQSKYLFGGHIDPKNGRYNLGMISWQKERGKELYNYLNRMGLIKGGKIVKSQEALNAQAMFGVKEMTTNPRFSKTKNQFLANSDIDYKQGAEVLGKNYIAWRYTDPKYAHHHKRRDKHYEKLNLELGNADVSKVLADDLKAIEAYYKEQDDILKEYQSTPERIKSEFDERVARIGKAGFDKQTQHDLNRKAEAIYQREMAVYQNSLDQKLDALTEYQQTESDKIERHREKLLFDLAVDPEYQLPENKDRLEAAKKAIEEEYEYATDKNQQRINAATNELYAFRKTEREILKEGYDNRISEALLMNDELKQLRIEALLEEQRYQLELFDKNQEMEMLELSKAHMTEMSYLKAEYDLKTKLIALSNADPEVKQVKEAEAKIVFERAQADVQKRVGGDYDAQTRGLFGISSAEADLAASNKSQRDIAEKAFQEGYIQEEEYKQRLLDLEEDYVNKKKALVVGGYESVFAMAGGLMKAFGGENSRFYKTMFLTEKAYALSSAILSNKKAIMDAWRDTPGGYFAKATAAGKIAMETGVITAAIAAIEPMGFKQGGYTGSIGVNEVAGVVHGQEYVFDAQATKRIGVDNLNAMRSGKVTGDTKVIIHNHSGEKAEVNRMSDGDIIVTIGKISESIADVKIAQFERRMQRQGGIIEKLSRG